MLNPNAKLVVDALRSGRFKQTRFQLARIDEGDCSYCCLGVICEVAAENGLNLRIGTDAFETTKIYNEEVCKLPNDVVDWIGFSSEQGRFYGQICGQSTLMSLNDYTCMSFAEIADIIESEPEGLFTKNIESVID